MKTCNKVVADDKALLFLSFQVGLAMQVMFWPISVLGDLFVRIPIFAGIFSGLIALSNLCLIGANFAGNSKWYKLLHIVGTTMVSILFVSGVAYLAWRGYTTSASIN